MSPAPTADTVDPVIPSGRTDPEQSAEPPGNDEGATPSRVGDVLAVLLGVLIGLLLFLALFVAVWHEVGKAWDSPNAAGIAKSTVIGVPAIHNS